MNTAQKLLVERSLRRLGYLLMGVFAALMSWGLFRLAINPSFTLERFVDGLLDTEDAALIVWTPLIAGSLCVWFSAFMKAGRSL